MSPQILNYVNEFHFYTENFYLKQDYYTFTNWNHLLYLNDYSSLSVLSCDTYPNFQTKSLIHFINQLEDLNLNNTVENVVSVYHYSIPNTKLAYPEPFIASPSFMHSDLWFVHILVYQYWLWFVFIFIIVFFFITFVCTLRWCNMRIRPRRETRGVSRSKCGDLITACVPVTWATSIIVNESTDAIDYYDGFGTTELVVGIRAYQWGWEYYYPKDIDLNYNIKPNYSIFVGNSLKYNKSSDLTLNSNNLWKFYQNKSFDQVITPAHLITLPIDNYKLLNFLNFNDIGSSPVYELNAFKKVRMFSKVFTSNLSFSLNNFFPRYRLLSNLYFSDNFYTDSYLYGLKRQHNFLSNNSFFINQSTLFNLKSIEKILLFNFNSNHENMLKTNQISFLNVLGNSTDESYPHINKIFSLFQTNRSKKNLKTFLNYFNNLKFNSTFLKNNNNLNILQSNYFLSMNSINTLNFYNTSFLTKANLFSESFHHLPKIKWSNINNFSKIVSYKSLPEYPFSPINSNHPSVIFSYVDKDKTFPFNSSSLPLAQKNKQISKLTSYIFSNFFSSNSSVDWRLTYDFDFYNISKNFYLPMFTFYYDYDFRNWQSIELLEDSYWESIFSIYSYDDYLNLVNDFDDYIFFEKWSILFNKFDRETKYTEHVLNKSFLEDLTYRNNFYSSPLYLDDELLSTNLLTYKDFFIFPIINLQLLFDDSYESVKYLNYLFNKNNLNYYAYGFFKISYHNFFSVFDMFRPDYDEFSWFFDDKTTLSLNKISNTFNFYNISEIFPTVESINYEKLNYLNRLLDINNASFLFTESTLLDSETNRFSNQINIRNPVKNSIVTFNAIQKVFRTRFDENRSHAKLNDFGNLYSKQLFINSAKTPYDKLLGKNKENFIKVNFYKNNFNTIINNSHDSSNSLNYYFFDFPFLMALKSDASRYLWFDWFAKWGFYEVQPSSSSRYAIYGMPYFNKAFEFSTFSNENLNESETYLLRLSRARKNYLPNWVYTPYLYAKHTNWYKTNLFFEIYRESQNLITSTWNLLNLMNWYWSGNNFINFNNNQFFPSISGINSYAKLGWKPQNSIQSYFYSISNLIDILTKREYLYRELLSTHNKIISLPFYLTNNPSNPLLSEIKTSFLFTDPIIINNEFSREVYFNSLAFFNSKILISFLQKFNEILNLNFLFDNIFSFFFNDYEISQNKNELFKSQYRPLRKGITNMIRLHATGAIAMPIEIRLQVLASSKDVIHSWAIPSAGIKIDCVPGYSSHKVMIFLVSGIFWGQCMEICGRYHHWMPIVVYFMKRDLFFLWCTHFVFLTGANNIWTINDREYTDYIRYASFDKNSWLNEIKI